MRRGGNGFLRFRLGLGIAALAVVCWCAPAWAADAVVEFRVGVATRDVTPRAAMPLWGYGARHAALSEGVSDPLFAKALVIQAGAERVAIVGVDLGRGPTTAMMEEIRRALADEADIRHVLISGSHTHHGPVIELTDREGFGRGRYDNAVRYAQRLPRELVATIVAANERLRPARIGWASKPISLNRNRHSKRTAKPIDRAMTVIRFDDSAGKPLAVLVNFAAHAVMTDRKELKFSADYPGFLRTAVERELGGTCVFMPGAAGDLSPAPPEGADGPRAYGEALAAEVVLLAGSVETAVPSRPSLAGHVERCQFRSRVDYSNYLIVAMLERAFFPELVHCYLHEYRDGIRPELTTVVLNGTIALLGGSGEFFCEHANRLKARSPMPATVFFGYCNGYHQYFPTIEAAAEGGYGTDPLLAPAELGAGERMMDRGLIAIGVLSGRFPAEALERGDAGRGR